MSSKSLAKLQREIQDFSREYNLMSPLEHRTLDLVSEVGEVAKEILKTTDYGRKPSKFHPEIKAELGDVLYSLITLANDLKIDLEEALRLVIKKYKRRLKKGSADSEND